MNLANFDESLQRSMEVMNCFHAVYEKQLANSNLTFDEKRELLNRFANCMLRVIAGMIEHSLSNESYQDPTDAHRKTLVAIKKILSNGSNCLYDE